LAALLLGGCAQNSVLELQLELPPAPPEDDGNGPWYAQVQVANASTPFELDWLDVDLEAVQLGDAPQWDCISVESLDDSIDLNVRVRFCRSPNCVDMPLGTAVEERFYRLEHPFYRGRRTYWRTRIPEVPECATDGDCGGFGQCVGGRCECESDAECAGELVCEANHCLEEVGRCSIEGCIEGVSTTFCSIDTGQHFCETNESIERLGAFECDVTVD
jgi:hypothetical protein